VSPSPTAAGSAEATARRGDAGTAPVEPASRRPRRPPTLNPVWWLNALIAAAALALFLGPANDFGAIEGGNLPWWLLALGFFLGERLVVHVHFRRSAHSFSLGDVPLVFGLLFATSADLVIGALIGTAATLMLDRKLPPIKLLFNLSQFTLAACLAVLVVHDLVGADAEMGPRLWIAVFLATQVSAVVTVLLIGTAIGLSEGGLKLRTIGQMLTMDFVVTTTNTSLALAGALIIATDARAIPLLVVPAITVFLAYRAYLLERQRHERLEFLYETTRTLAHSPEIVLALEGLLKRSLEAFRAEVAEIVLFSSDGSPPLRTTLGPGDYKEVMQPIDPEFADELRALVSSETPAVRVERPFESEQLRRYLDSRLVTDSMIAMLPGEKRVIGTIMLANRFGVIKAFSDDDLKLFETLANNASVALQYDRLEQAVLQLRELQEQLHHQAFHDPLTDLANRSLFINQVRDALEERTGNVGVLFVDVDDFKTINDSLGHGAGDDLLVAVADRLRDCLRPSDAIARLGGDEFAVMVLGEDQSLDAAVAVAERIMRAFEVPVAVGDDLIYVHLSIGIATTRHSKRADELIRDADLAMYRAKETGKKRFELFEPEMRAAVLRRHGLKEELQRALERRELILEYQPIVALASGETVAAEALVRWHHPTRGRLLPAEFVPLAEETGLIIAVGQFVLEQACRQAVSWEQRKDGRGPRAVHVNLSAVELQDSGVTSGVSQALAEAGLEPGRLVLEITESLAQDVDAGTTLRGLRELGVRLALDDFGTGYSSLSYLRSLPLDILKIARPFIDGISRGQQESSFVRMIIDLARTLDLQVIAEGIESAAELEALRALDCELGQGFYLGRELVKEERAVGISSASITPTPDRNRTSVQKA
jgi:diguanylate cyclase (GGDEF)-like protein